MATVAEALAAARRKTAEAQAAAAAAAAAENQPSPAPPPSSDPQLGSFLTQAFGGWATSDNDKLGVALDQAFQGYNAHPPPPPDPDVSRTNPQNDRYGTDLSWLDPDFQYTPTMLGQSAGSQAYADPNAIAAQNSAMGAYGGMFGKQMNFAGSGKQDAAYADWGAIKNGAGAPTFMGNGMQTSLMNAISGLQNPQWDTSGRMDASYDQWGSVARGEGAPRFMGSGEQRAQLNKYGQLTGPQFQGAGQQQGILDQFQDIANSGGKQGIEWQNPGQQQEVLDQFGNIVQSGGKEGLDWDNGERQGDQYANLEEIIAGGGATKIEMANREAQRQDQGQWLRSQREADMQARAQRGQSGSGSELLDLAVDRQAAAQRNSLADLQTAAQLEQRRTDAIKSAGDLAGVMRGQKNQQESIEAQRSDSALQNKGNLANQLRADQYNEQAFEAQRGDNALGQAGNLANRLRADKFNEESYRTGYELNKLNSQTDLLNTIRGQDFNEISYNDQRKLTGMQQQSALAQALRQAQYQESAFTAGFGLDKLNSQANIANTMRSQDFGEKSYLDTRVINALANQTNLANQLRQDQFNEATAQRNSDFNALDGYSNQANTIRNSSFNENYLRGQSADQFAQLNQSAINQAKSQNTAFLQNSYQNMINNRQNWEMNKLNMGIGVAQGMKGSDVQENQFGTTQGTNLAGNDANAFNNAKTNANSTFMGVQTNNSANILQSTINGNNTMANVIWPTAGAYADSIFTTAAGGMGGGGMGGAMGGAKGAAGGGLSQPGTTWASGGFNDGTNYADLFNSLGTGQKPGVDPTKNRTF